MKISTTVLFILVRVCIATDHFLRASTNSLHFSKNAAGGKGQCFAQNKFRKNFNLSLSVHLPWKALWKHGQLRFSFKLIPCGCFSNDVMKSYWFANQSESSSNNHDCCSITICTRKIRNCFLKILRFDLDRSFTTQEFYLYLRQYSETRIEDLQVLLWSFLFLQFDDCMLNNYLPFGFVLGQSKTLSEDRSFVQ